MAYKILSIPGEESPQAIKSPEQMPAREAWQLEPSAAFKQYEAARPGIDYSAGEQQYAQAFQQPYQEPETPAGQGLEKIGRAGASVLSSLAGLPADIADLIPNIANLTAYTAGYEPPFSETAASDILGIPGSKRIKQAIGLGASKSGIHPASLEAPPGTWEERFNTLLETVSPGGRAAFRNLPRAAVRQVAGETAAKFAPERLKPAAALTAGIGTSYLINKVPAAKRALQHLENEKITSFKQAEEATKGKTLDVGPILSESEKIQSDVEGLPSTDNFKKLKHEYGEVYKNLKEHAGKQQVLKDEFGNVLARGENAIEAYKKERPQLLGPSGKPQALRTVIEQGEIPADQALKLYRIYNEMIYDPSTNAKVVNRTMKLRNALGKKLDEFGTKVPEFGTNFRKSNLIHEAQAESSKIGNWLGKNVDKIEGKIQDKKLFEILLNAGVTAAGIGLGHASLPKAALAGLALAGGGAAAYGAGKYAKFSDLMRRYKPLQQNYINFQKAIQKENLAETLKYGQKINDMIDRLGGLPEDASREEFNIDSLIGPRQ